MADKNPQNAKVGDLIMWTSNAGGFNFGKIIGWMQDGRPTVRPIRGSWFEEKRYVGYKYVPDEKGYFRQDFEDGKVRCRYESIYEEVNVTHPASYYHGQQSGHSWMVIAYGDGRVETTTEEHPIAKVRRQFAELEGQKGYAF